jgi:hypothetical protein
VGGIRSQAATNRRFGPYQRRNWLASGLEQPKTTARTTYRLLKKSLIVASATHTPISAKLSNADFWLWEHDGGPVPVVGSDPGFYPQCGFLALGTPTQ